MRVEEITFCPVKIHLPMHRKQAICRELDQGLGEGEFVGGDVAAEKDDGPPVGVGGSVSVEVVRH